MVHEISYKTNDSMGMIDTNGRYTLSEVSNTFLNNLEGRRGKKTTGSLPLRFWLGSSTMPSKSFQVDRTSHRLRLQVTQDWYKVISQEDDIPRPFSTAETKSKWHLKRETWLVTFVSSKVTRLGTELTKTDSYILLIRTFHKK